MQVALLGTGPLGLATARVLIDRGHVVRRLALPERSIHALADVCLAPLGPGRAELRRVLGDLEPGQTDCLLLLTSDEALDVLAAGIARSMGQRRVVPRLCDLRFAGVCGELGIAEVLHAPPAGPLRLVRIAPPGRVDGDVPAAATLRLLVAPLEADGSPVTSCLPGDVHLVARVHDGGLELLRPGRAPRPGDELVLLVPHTRLRQLTRRLARQAR